MKFSASATSYYAIRTLAMTTMLIDHIGMMFWPEAEVLRAVGRIAYPLYAFGIACGWMHTRSRQKYIWRLLLVAVMAQVFWPLQGGNVVFGFVAVLVWMAWMQPHIVVLMQAPPRAIDALAIAASWGALCAASVLLGVDYAFETMVYVPSNCALLWMMHTHGRAPVWLPSMLYVAVSALLAIPGVTQPRIQPFLWGIALIAPAVIARHNEGKVAVAPWFHHLYFWFYPAHLALLYTVAVAIG